MKTSPRFYKYGQERHSSTAGNESHIIKIGISKTPNGDKFLSPTVGFFIVHDTVGVGTSFPVDYDAMAALGYDKEQVTNALTKGRNATAGSLPDSIEFRIISDARRDADGDWDFSGIAVASYQAWHTTGIIDPEWKASGGVCNGLFCKGDGDVYVRKQPDGTVRRGACNPYGKDGVAPQDFCPYSRPGGKSPCKLKGTLSLALCKRTAPTKESPTGELVPLIPSYAAKARYETSSARNMMTVFKALREAAIALNGNLNGLYGVIQFYTHKDVVPSDPGKVAQSGLVPHVRFSLNPWQISKRLEEVNGERRIASLLPAAMIAMDDDMSLDADDDTEAVYTEDGPVLDDRQQYDPPPPIPAVEVGPPVIVVGEYNPEIAKASYDELMASLMQLLDVTVQADGIADTGEAMRLLTDISFRVGDKPARRWSTADVNFFRKLPDEKKEGAIQTLRIVCQKLLITDSRFEFVSIPTTTEPVE